MSSEGSHKRRLQVDSGVLAKQRAVRRVDNFRHRQGIDLSTRAAPRSRRAAIGWCAGSASPSAHARWSHWVPTFSPSLDSCAGSTSTIRENSYEKRSRRRGGSVSRSARRSRGTGGRPEAPGARASGGGAAARVRRRRASGGRGRRRAGAARRPIEPRGRRGPERPRARGGTRAARRPLRGVLRHDGPGRGALSAKERFGNFGSGKVEPQNHRHRYRGFG